MEEDKKEEKIETAILEQKDLLQMITREQLKQLMKELLEEIEEEKQSKEKITIEDEKEELEEVMVIQELEEESVSKFVEGIFLK